MSVQVRVIDKMPKYEELSRCFAEMLLEELGESVLKTVNELNKNNSGSNIMCQSLHYCDSNKIMLNAFLEVFGEELNFRDASHISTIVDAWYEAQYFDFYMEDRA